MKPRIIVYGLLVAAIGAFAFFLRSETGGISRESVARRMTCELLPRVIERFHADVGRYPTTAEGFSVLLHAPEKDWVSGWKGPYLPEARIPKDPWNREYGYRVPARKPSLPYEVFSLGPDGKISDDDIGNFSE